MNLIDCVGNTPLLKIKHLNDVKVSLFGKLEYMNPSGSVKDRPARAMLLDAVEKGLLESRTVIEATSGNTGIALAMMAAELKVPIEIALPENASPERKTILAAYGAKLHFTDPLEGTDGAQRFTAARCQEYPEKYVYLDQYNNDRNWQSHFETTGPEIWEQTRGAVTHFVTGLGTTGTFIGVSRFLKRKGVHCVAVHPNNPMHGLEGWKHLETAIVPGIYDPNVADENIDVDTEDAFRYAKAASLFLGLYISPSAAANMFAAMRYAQQLTHGTVVTIITDSALKYLHQQFWTEDDYTIENPFF